MKSPKNIAKLVDKAIEVESQSAKETGELGFTAATLVQLTLPYRKPKEMYYTRRNGDKELVMVADPRWGMPYGAIPRLLMAWITTEATRTESPEIRLGKNLSEFLRDLEMGRSGGETGRITALRKQMNNLFRCTIHIDDLKNPNIDNGKSMLITEERHLFWDPKQPDQDGLFESKILLGQRFYDLIIKNPVPIDLRVLKALKQSAMALDIYCWLTYRMYKLNSPTPISWKALKEQFGPEYTRVRDFKAAFLRELQKVLTFYREANVTNNIKGLLLKPSPTHIPKVGKKPVD